MIFYVMLGCLVLSYLLVSYHVLPTCQLARLIQRLSEERAQLSRFLGAGGCNRAPRRGAQFTVEQPPEPQPALTNTGPQKHAAVWSFLSHVRRTSGVPDEFQRASTLQRAECLLNNHPIG